MKIKSRFKRVIKRAIHVLLPLAVLLRHPHSIQFAHSWRVSFLPGHNPLRDQMPWVTFKARTWLEAYLKPDMFVFEWGSGGSTLFIAKRANKLISVEHDMGWYDRVLAPSDMSRTELPDTRKYAVGNPDYLILVGYLERARLSALKSPSSGYQITAQFQFSNPFGIEMTFPFVNPEVYIFQRHKTPKGANASQTQ